MVMLQIRQNILLYNNACCVDIVWSDNEVSVGFSPVSHGKSIWNVWKPPLEQIVPSKGESKCWVYESRRIACEAFLVREVGGHFACPEEGS